MSTVTEKKYVLLRKRLDQLGYRQALAIESMPLVERLFSDLLHTTDSLKKAKLGASKITDSTKLDNSQAVEDAIEPYRVDNARLVQENNGLHLDFVKTKEELEATTKSLKATIRKLEHENADLRFLNSQYIHKVKAVERESASKTDTIQKLQEKNLQAVIQTPGGKKRNIPFRRQRMQIDSTLPQSETSSYTSAQPDDPYIADLVQVADTKINQLSVEVKKLEENEEINVNKIKNLRKQVEGRDREIDRLNRSLEGGRPHDVVSLEAKNRSNERLISHLNLQVDYLQQTNQELEDRIQELEDGKGVAVAESQRLGREVDRLHSELRDIDRLAQQLEQEKQEAVVAADREVHEAKLELRSSQRQGDSVESRLIEANTVRDRLLTENGDLQAELEGTKLDVERLNGLLDKVQSDKRLLSDKVQTLSGKEKSMILELEQYRISPSRARRRDKSPSKLDSFVRTLEQERDHYREECDLLQSMLREYKNKGSRSSSPRSKSPSRPPSRKGGDTSSEAYQQLLRERDELQTMLNKFERHMAEIQANVKVLTQERDKTNSLYEQTNDELQRLRREYVRSPKSPKASLTAQAILRRVENERDTSIADLRRMTTERDSLRERLKIQQEQSINERSRLEQRAEDLENKARALAQERIDLQSRVDSLTDVNLAQEDDIKALRLKIQQIEDDYQAVRNELEDVRALKTQVEASLDNTQRNLSRKSTDLALSEDRVRTLENRVSELLDTASKQTEEAAGLRATATSLDREKDALQAALDERTERAASLDEQLARRERDISDMRVSISNLEAKLDRAGDDLASSEREVRSLRRQLDSTQSDLSDNSRAKESAMRENRRLQDDLSTLTRENQDINLELDDAMRDRDDLKTKVQDDMARISILEGNLASKERELQDVLDQYRKVSSERDSAESRYRVSSDETQTMRNELIAADSDRKRYSDKIAVLERDIAGHLHARQTYEAQVSSLTSAVANLESELDRVRGERHNLQEDLQSVRDLNAKLDSNKEQIARNLASKNVEHEQLQAGYEDLNRELEIVHKHLETERVGNKNLEDLVAGAREKEFQAQLDAQEQKSEGQLLRDKLALNESKMQSMSREVASLRDRTSQLDAELEVTKRHLTNERYERERAVQELRRHGLPSPGLSRLSRPLSPTSRGSRSGSPAKVSFLDDGR
ncbi:centrosomal protein of 135 kDa-like isoform X2 [Clavelina lepadiformis]|uniref:centrosomal protein of 135 kDa-like isoform X2 n=1 Tax=Clavelina lepadiformis TaxID=159417 RepID=UPI004042E9FB